MVPGAFCCTGSVVAPLLQSCAHLMVVVVKGPGCALTGEHGGATIAFARGDVAQLGERCLRKAEAGGSNPLISTICVLQAGRHRGVRPFCCRRSRTKLSEALPAVGSAGVAGGSSFVGLRNGHSSACELFAYALRCLRAGLGRARLYGAGNGGSAAQKFWKHDRCEP